MEQNIGVVRGRDILHPFNAELIETTHQIGNQHDQQNGPEPDPGSSAIAPSPVAIIATASAEEKNQQNNQKQHCFALE
jgi:hypothetical protein